MGTGSTKVQRPRSHTRIIPREPEDEKYCIPEEEPNYPRAVYPTVPTQDVYNPKDNREIYLHAINAPYDLDTSWDDLIHYLTSSYRKDIDKVRSIFAWLGTQNIENDNYFMIPTLENLEDVTPRGFKKVIQQGRASYASFFALLCRKAGIRCAVIYGLSKGFGYDVGVTEDRHLKDKWNAVYLDGWRLIHPLWSFKTVISYKSGKWVPNKLEEKIEVEDLAEEVDPVVQHDFNEYYFLVEPSEFINACLPDKDKWQMCPTVITKEMWLKLPFFMKRYHMEGFNIPNEFKTTLKTKKGYCSVIIENPSKKEDSPDFQLAYDFFFNFVEGKTDSEDAIYLEKYAILAKDSEKGVWVLEVRMPVAGLYRVTLYGGLSSEAKLPWVCDLAINCKKIAKDVKPYPASPKIGFGPVEMTTKAGLMHPSHTHGLLFVKCDETYHITFKIQRKMEAKASLTSNTVDTSETAKWLSITQNPQGSHFILDAVIKIREDGEYALKIYVKIENDWKNVCNYYLSTDSPRRHGLQVKDKGYKTAKEIDIDQAIEKAKKGTDLFEVKNEVEDEKKEIDLREDEGSFGKATLKMEYLELAKALKDAINNKEYRSLKTAVQLAEKSDHTQRLNNLIIQANKEIESINPHIRCILDVLDIEPEAVENMAAQESPSDTLKDVLHAVLILLGEVPTNLMTWEAMKTHFLLEATKDFFRRVREFSVDSVSNDTIIEAGLVIAKYDEKDMPEINSSLLTLFKWVKSVVDWKVKQGT